MRSRIIGEVMLLRLTRPSILLGCSLIIPQGASSLGVGQTNSGGHPLKSSLVTMEATALEDVQEPLLDGNLDDPAWAQAEVTNVFLQREPSEGSPATEATEVRIVYTKKSLYLGVLCNDSQPDLIRATELGRDDELDNDDSFAVLFDTFHDGRNAYLFRTNALGTRFDALITDEKEQLNSEWDEKWQVESRITESGWVAEIEIPWKTFRSKGGRGQIWGLNFERQIKRKNEDVYWSGYSRDFEFHNVSQAGILTGLEDVKTGLRLRIKPYLLGGVTQLPVQGSGSSHFQNESDVGLEVVKASLTSSITADFTLNPDFAQAEVDQARFNLTRFDLFFPEKREFFLENAGVFDFGTRQGPRGIPEVLAFFSRRVGLVDGLPVPIETGARVTGNQSGFQFGFLNLRTRSQEEFAGDASTIGRLKWKLLDRSYLGAMFTRHTLDGSDHTNQLGGLDASFVLFDRLQLSGYWARTTVADEEGLSYQGSANWLSDGWEFELHRVRVDEDFTPELGFVLRDNIVKHRARVAWKPRSGGDWVRQWRFESDNLWFTNQQDFLESRENKIAVGPFFESGDFLGVSYKSKYEALEEDFEVSSGIFIPAGSYDSEEVAVFGQTFPGRKVSGNYRVDYGSFFGGTFFSGTFGSLFKITERLSFQIDHNVSTGSLPAGDFTVNVINTRTNYNFTNKLLTSASIQYNSEDRRFLINWRLNFIHRPGDDLFVVYNEGRDFDQPFSNLVNRTFLVKYTRSFDF